jgi:hypothetical protein
VDAALSFRGRHPLHAVYPAFVFQLGIDLGAVDSRDDFLYATERRRRAFEDFHLPVLRFRVTRVHAEKLGGEKRGFVTASAGANFHDDAFLVVGVFGQQQNF